MTKKNNQQQINPETLMLAYLCIKDIDGLAKQVEILDRFNLPDALKAQVCNVAVQSIRDARQKLKKKKNPKNK